MHAGNGTLLVLEICLSVMTGLWSAVCNAPKTEVTCLSTVQGVSRMEHANRLLCGTVSSEPSILSQHKQGMGTLQQQERLLP